MSEQPGSHEAIEDLAGAAALRALTRDEVRVVAEHLATCQRCRALHGELRATADLLLRLPAPIPPSADLRARLMAEVARTPQDQPATGPIPIGRSARGRSAARLASLGWREWGLLGSVAATLYFGVWTLRLQNEVGLMSTQLARQEALVRAATRGRIVRLAGTPAAPQVTGAVAETPEQTLVYLENLPEPPDNRAYQVWLIPPGGQPIGAGVSAPGEGGAPTIRLDRPLANVEAVAITQEPAGGSPAPTSDVLAAGRL